MNIPYLLIVKNIFENISKGFISRSNAKLHLSSGRLVCAKKFVLSFQIKGLLQSNYHK